MCGCVFCIHNCIQHGRDHVVTACLSFLGIKFHYFISRHYGFLYLKLKCVIILNIYILSKNVLLYSTKSSSLVHNHRVTTFCAI